MCSMDRATASVWAMRELVDSMIIDGLWDAYNNYHMGMTAENIAKQFGDLAARAGRVCFSSVATKGRGCSKGRSKFKAEIAPY